MGGLFFTLRTWSGPNPWCSEPADRQTAVLTFRSFGFSSAAASIADALEELTDVEDEEEDVVDLPPLPDLLGDEERDSLPLLLYLSKDGSTAISFDILLPLLEGVYSRGEHGSDDLLSFWWPRLSALKGNASVSNFSTVDVGRAKFSSGYAGAELINSSDRLTFLFPMAFSEKSDDLDTFWTLPDGTEDMVGISFIPVDSFLL
jgi:hypothetical protein